MAATPNDLLRRLFEYIGEQLKDIDPRGFQLKHAGFKCEPQDLAGLPGVEFDIKVEGDYIWLRIARLEGNNPPKPKESQHGLFHISCDPFGPAPTINEAVMLQQISNETKDKAKSERGYIETKIRYYAKAALKEYIGIWKSWAEGEKPRRKTISLYGDLFALKHQMEAEETTKPTELVWGVGVSTWQLPFKGINFPYIYPLLTQAVEIFLDEKNMALEVRPRATDTRFEMDPFVACQISGAADVERAGREHIARHKDRPVSPFDPSSYADVLKLAATNLDSKGSYREVLTSRGIVPDPQEGFIVTDSWVLFSRARANNFLIDDLKRLQEKIASGCDLPAGPLALVTPPSDKPVEFEPVNFRGISSRGDTRGGAKPEELYFPLPYNNEQITIVQRLERAAGVTVQGPPGTGKTHTIANIICHYLATGRRVLVTSRGEPALAVLQKKIPEEIRPLTVALLASDRDGIRQFQASIEAIQHRVSQLNPEKIREQINILKQAIDRAHAELEGIDRRIDEIASGQLSEVKIDDVPMRAEKLAELVVLGKERYGWFDDDLSLKPEHAPPFTEDEGSRLRECRRKLGKDLIYAYAEIPAVDELISPGEIAELHNLLSQIKKHDAQVSAGNIIPLRGFTEEIIQAARELLNNIDEIKTVVEELESFDNAWPMELRLKCRLASFTSERQALESLFDDVRALTEARAEFLKRPVEFPEVGLGLVKVREAVARAVETGKPFGFPFIIAGDEKKILSSVTIAGLRPKGKEDWGHVQRYLLLHDQVISFLSRWNQFAETLSVPPLNGNVSSLRQIEMVATAAQKAHKLATLFDPKLPAKAEAVFEKIITKELMGGSTDLQIVRDQLIRHLTRVELSKASTSLSILQAKLAGKSGPITDELREFIENDLGNPEIDASRISARFVELCAELRRIAGLSMDLCIIREYAERLEKAGGVKLAARIKSTPVDENGEDRVFSPTWREAWTWARVKSHLEKIESREELVALSDRRRGLEKGLSRLYKDMVSLTAWLATKRNSSPKVLQALAGYSTAMRRIGQGTGPNAVRYRRDARESMLDAAGAVPCWIMSHAKISESMPADIGMFDLVIVDEASQSDLWALPAIVRGKKILVVGDDKQVSPDGGFISSQRIDELKHRFLTEQPYGIEMTPEKSLYDLAARVFAAEQVMLREHFRCVPPIISYSNRVFYKNSIYPLRIPKGSERIDPPLVDIYVENGIRDQQDCNRAEAEAIAEQVVAILKDDRFAKRTIGVVSLLGMPQAKHIDSLVRQHCSAAELLLRKFDCGDARTFQGSERDIMFLSLVVDPTDCRALSGNMFEQRFNVAASRARDRMYLVRSVKASHLSDRDLRLTLLNHFDKPLVTTEIEAEDLMSRCESGFEREVYKRLVKKGYRVTPQVKTGAYRIDMVVEGSNDCRLAIECDGDEFHGPDRWQHDMNRQRVLERAGWVFWRCFASTWILRKEDIFNELLGNLTAMGIEPLGALEKAPSFVEKRTWRFSEVKENDVVDEVLEKAIEVNDNDLFPRK